MGQSASQKTVDLAVGLDVKLGATYRRLKRPEDAIAVLEEAFEVNPGNATLASELGKAYLSSKTDDKAIAVAERLIESEPFAALAPGDKVTLLLIAGRGLYNKRQLDRARKRYEAAYAVRKSDVQVRIGLVQTVNLQAFEAMSRGELDVASKYLGEAYEFDKRSTLTNKNLAIVALQQKQCDRAKKHLTALEKAPGTALMYHRLLARAYACQRKPNRQQASRHYAAAEKLALDPNLQANLLRAEIYSEWAPLLFDSNLDNAVAKLEVAVQLSARNPEVGNAARRNLAIATYRRGWRNLAARKLSAAVSDFETATRAPDLLRGSEVAVFRFSLAVAHLENGDSNKATRIFSGLVAKNQRESFLRAPYDRVGVRFFDAYAKYRSSNRRLQRQAARTFGRLQGRATGTFAEKLRDLTTATWLSIAADAYRANSGREVKEALSNATRSARSDKMKRLIEHDRIVLAIGERGVPRSAMARLQTLANTVPEAYANLGILYHRQGKPKEAYQSWVRARQRGVRSRDLQQWIGAKKRMFGF